MSFEIPSVSFFLLYIIVEIFLIRSGTARRNFANLYLLVLSPIRGIHTARTVLARPIQFTYFNVISTISRMRLQSSARRLIASYGRWMYNYTGEIQWRKNVLFLRNNRVFFFYYEICTYYFVWLRILLNRSLWILYFS